MAKKRSKPKPKVYSYIRFSTPDQLKGDSLRRQLKMSEEWCERNGQVLDRSLRLHDLGVSAFNGRNATHGRLAAFLKAVDDGTVAKGSILLVESLDRLTRNQVGEALELFLGILRRGITIVTLNPEDTFDKDSINDVVKIIIALVIMSRAYEESATKSKRMRTAWSQKRHDAQSNGKRLTRKIPAWLDKQTFEVLPRAADTIRRIFDLKLQGKGSRSVAKELNQDDTAWERPKGWHAAYVNRILGNRAVIGELQTNKLVERKQVPDGEPVEGYFPAIVDRDVFFAVQKIRDADRRKQDGRGTGGRNGKIGNLFTHFIKCPYCGSSMTYQIKKGGYKYLICGTALRGRGCQYVAARYDEIDDVERKLKNLDEAYAETNEKLVRKRLQAKMLDLEQSKVKLQDRRKDTERELESTEADRRTYREWQSDLQELREGLASGAPELRSRLRSHLRSFITRIEVFTKGHVGEYDVDTRDGDLLRTYIEDFEPEWDVPKKFMKYALEQRMSPRGRFVRVWYGDNYIDFVPEASIATGWRDNRFHYPPVNLLWDEYCEL